MSQVGDVWLSPCGRMELRCGRWQDVLADVTERDACITDPPYGERTHNGQRHRRHDRAETIATKKIPHGLGYQTLTDDGVVEIAPRWSAAARNWMFCLTSQSGLEFEQRWLTREGQ